MSLILFLELPGELLLSLKVTGGSLPVAVLVVLAGGSSKLELASDLVPSVTSSTCTGEFLGTFDSVVIHTLVCLVFADFACYSCQHNILEMFLYIV